MVSYELKLKKMTAKKFWYQLLMKGRIRMQPYYLREEASALFTEKQ